MSEIPRQHVGHRRSDEMNALHMRLEKRDADVALLREALKCLMPWHMTEDHYVRIGFRRGRSALAYEAAYKAMEATK